jgi:predicted dehydrogenase
MLVGAIEEWHPNPDIFFGEAGGPLLDMGPYYLTAIVALLGPVHRVAGFASTPVAERTIGFGPRTGEVFEAAMPTHVAATLELENGATANVVTSFEAPALYVCDLVIHGTDGVLALPDPNAFEGPVRLKRGRSEWEDVPLSLADGRDARGIGLDDMARASRMTGSTAPPARWRSTSWTWPGRSSRRPRKHARSKWRRRSSGPSR